MSDQTLVSTPDAARLMGVPPEEFSRLVKVLGIEPAQAGTKTTPRLWDRALVEQLAKGPEGEELREAIARKDKVRALRQELARRYPDWQEALRPAAEALFTFNRYAKYASCSRLRRRELYEVKDAVVRMLYERGLCQEASLHTVVGAEADCETCDGAGQDGRGGACPVCGGRGTVAPDEPQEFVLFGFMVGGRWFEWHSPRKAVSWPFTPTASANRKHDWKPKGAEKPIQSAGDTEFLEAEAHLQFVLHKHEDEKKAQREQEKRKRWEEMRREGLERQARLRAEQEGGQKPDAS